MGVINSQLSSRRRERVSNRVDANAQLLCRRAVGTCCVVRSENLLLVLGQAAHVGSSNLGRCFPAPYVLVATSGGGFIAAEFAREHAADVAGIVLLDVPGLSDPQPSFPPELVERLACEHPLNIERRDYLGVERDALQQRVLRLGAASL